MSVEQRFHAKPRPGLELSLPLYVLLERTMQPLCSLLKVSSKSSAVAIERRPFIHAYQIVNALKVRTASCAILYRM